MALDFNKIKDIQNAPKEQDVFDINEEHKKFRWQFEDHQKLYELEKALQTNLEEAANDHNPFVTVSLKIIRFNSNSNFAAVLYIGRSPIYLNNYIPKDNIKSDLEWHQQELMTFLKETEKLKIVPLVIDDNMSDPDEEEFDLIKILMTFN